VILKRPKRLCPLLPFSSPASSFFFFLPPIGNLRLRFSIPCGIKSLAPFSFSFFFSKFCAWLVVALLRPLFFPSPLRNNSMFSSLFVSRDVFAPSSPPRLPTKFFPHILSRVLSSSPHPPNTSPPLRFTMGKCGPFTPSTLHVSRSHSFPSAQHMTFDSSLGTQVAFCALPFPSSSRRNPKASLSSPSLSASSRIEDSVAPGMSNY